MEGSICGWKSVSIFLTLCDELEVDVLVVQSDEVMACFVVFVFLS